MSSAYLPKELLEIVQYYCKSLSSLEPGKLDIPYLIKERNNPLLFLAHFSGPTCGVQFIKAADNKNETFCTISSCVEKGTSKLSRGFYSYSTTPLTLLVSHLALSVPSIRSYFYLLKKQYKNFTGLDMDVIRARIGTLTFLDSIMSSKKDIPLNTYLVACLYEEGLIPNLRFEKSTQECYNLLLKSISEMK